MCWCLKIIIFIRKMTCLFCKCCRESGLQTRTVSLYCSRNATMVDYNFQEPLDCSCHEDHRRCSILLRASRNDSVLEMKTLHFSECL
uniref:Secreted protein n=1 Tax=Fundulus heteroclitus TaxID=8078 RepID=A0A3Q2Q9Y1_FUNHE